MQFYECKSSNETRNAQMNLEGRTHYVDAQTLRFHKSRITASGDTCDGLLFYIIESVALDYQNTKRGFRAVVFDLFGGVVYRPNLDATFRTSAQARKAMYAFLDSCSAVALTDAAIDAQEKTYAYEIREARAKLFGKIGQKVAA